MCTSHGTLVKSSLVRPRLFAAFSVTHLLEPPVWEHILWAQLLLARKVLVPPLAERTQFIVQGLVPNREHLFFFFLVNRNLKFKHGDIDTSDSDSTHHQCRLSFLRWNPGRRWNPTNVVSADCGFMRLFLRKSVAQKRQRDYAVLTYKVNSTSESTWCLIYSSSLTVAFIVAKKT